jgi:hypothetical protein
MSAVLYLGGLLLNDSPFLLGGTKCGHIYRPFALLLGAKAFAYYENKNQNYGRRQILKGDQL